MAVTYDDIKLWLSTETLKVKFMKKDGTVRDMLCTLRPDLLPPLAPNTLAGEPTIKSNPESIAVWDLEQKGWRSFRIDSILGVEVRLPKDDEWTIYKRHYDFPGYAGVMSENGE